MQIDILPRVDLSRSYSRGTFARYDGGIIRSFRDTLPGEPLEKSGWEVILAGISKINISQGEDPRVFVVRSQLTAGDIVEAKFSIPAMIYREIYKSEIIYQRGDVVTWGGSAWHCQVDHPKSAPGKDGEWKLMVKEGQRGKDGKDGERGPQGPPGKDRYITGLGD